MTFDAPLLAPGLSAPAETTAERWGALPRWVQIVAIFAALSIMYQVSISIVGGVRGTSNHVTGQSSSYDNSRDGTAGFAQLLTTRGYAVTHLVSTLSQRPVAASSTLFILQPTSWSTSDAHDVATGVRAGAIVVVSGDAASLDSLAALSPQTKVRWRTAAVGVARSSGSTSFDSNVATLSSLGPGSFVAASLGSGVSVLATGPGGVLALAAHDHGWLVVLATSSALQNSSLASADNAAFALNLAGAKSGPVTFDEYVHGIGAPGTGLAGLPGPWRWGLGMILAAIGVWIIAELRRFGPPQRTERTLIPARAQYVDAMANLLSSHRFEEIAPALNPINEEVRRRVAGHLGVAPNATDDDLFRAATAASSSERAFAELVVTATTIPSSPTEALALGRALREVRSPTPSEQESHV